jgi:hypothetical protein
MSSDLYNRLSELVIRLETVGHRPRRIYTQLAKHVDRALAWQVVHDVTGYDGRSSDETRAKQAAAMTGRSPSPEVRAKISASCMGRPVSMAARAKISATMKGRAHTPHSAEARAKIAAAQIGRACSEATRAKISASCMGRVVSMATRAKISATLARKSKKP